MSFKALKWNKSPLRVQAHFVTFQQIALACQCDIDELFGVEELVKHVGEIAKKSERMLVRFCTTDDGLNDKHSRLIVVPPQRVVLMRIRLLWLIHQRLLLLLNVTLTATELCCWRWLCLTASSCHAGLGGRTGTWTRLLLTRWGIQDVFLAAVDWSCCRWLAGGRRHDYWTSVLTFLKTRKFTMKIT